MGSSSPLRRELLLAFGLLFGGGLILASVGMAILLPVLDSPGQIALYVLVLLLADLGVVFLFGRRVLGQTLLEPMDRLVEDVHAIASGAFDHRIRPVATRELQVVADSVNALAERLIRDQEILSQNVRSLDGTNKALVEARAQVVRAARLASTGTLASGIAHELGNPLAAVIAYVDVALGRAEAEGQDTELLEGIKEDAIRMDRIIRSLLNFARSRETEVVAQDPWPVVERVRRLLEAQGRLDEVDAGWDCQGEIPPVLMDAQRWEQVLVNLLLNALDAMEGRRDRMIRVTLRVEPGPGAGFPRRRAGDPPGVDYAHRRRVVSTEDGVRVSFLATAVQVVALEVEDNGPGLPPDKLEEIFDPFFTTKEPGKGTGLGLAISAQLVEGMGGEIEARNRPGGGAVFTVRLPEAGWGSVAGHGIPSETGEDA